jgi:outer membrane protein assembly factor BamE
MMPLLQFTPQRNMRIKIILLALLLASCSLKPYKMDIYQGNFVTPQMREQLKPGMTRQQVRYVLGTPLVNDPFHANRWDYVFRHEHGGKLVEQQHLMLIFVNDRLQRIDDGKQVIEAEPDATPDVVAQKVPVVVDTPPPPTVSAPPTPSVQALPAPQVEIRNALQAWSEAWSAQDVDQYFASYADDFRPKGMSNAAWRKQRRERISKPRQIEVTLADVRIERQDETHARAAFTQNYRADGRHDASQKTLQLEKIGGAWLIVAEQTTGKQK